MERSTISCLESTSPKGGLTSEILSFLEKSAKVKNFLRLSHLYCVVASVQLWSFGFGGSNLQDFLQSLKNQHSPRKLQITFLRIIPFKKVICSGEEFFP